MALLSCIMLSKRPIFDFPGFMSASVYATITDPSKFPSCEGVINASTKTQLWPSSTGQVDQCGSDLLDMTIINGKVQTREGVIIETDEIFATDGVEYLPGYTNVFKVPYDWIHFYLNTDDVFGKLKAKIESEVEKAGQKAIITGYSYGGNAMRRFLTHFVDDEWKEKYIGGACFLAAAMGGAFSAAQYLYRSKVYDLGSPFVKHMPSLFALLPNFPTNVNIGTVNGRQLDAATIYQEMKNAGKTDEITDALYNEIVPYLEEQIKDPNVRALVAFNSGLDTICGIDIDGDKSTEKFCGGDAIVASAASEYAGSHWKDVQVYDFKKNDVNYDHSHLALDPKMSEVVSAFIESTKDGLSKSAIAGIVIASVAAAATIVIVIVVLVLRKRTGGKGRVIMEYEGLTDE